MFPTLPSAVTQLWILCDSPAPLEIHDTAVLHFQTLAWQKENPIQELSTSSWLWQLYKVPFLTLETLVLRYTEFESEKFLYIRADFVQRPLTWSQKTEESGQTKNTSPAAANR